MVVFPSPEGGSRPDVPPEGRAGTRAGGLFTTRGWTWRHWLALGACFAIGHGIAERLLHLRGEEEAAGFQNFAVQPFPGQSLEALRRRHGGPVLPLRADLDAIEADRRMARQQAETEERRGELEAELRAEQQQAREEAERSRLEALDQPRSSGAAPAPAATAPEPPSLPPPAEPAAGPALPALPQAPPAPSPGGMP